MRFFFDVRMLQLQSKSNSPPIHVQSKSNTELVVYSLYNETAFCECFKRIRCRSVSPSLLIRFKSVPITIGSWDLQGTYMGGTWEVE